MHKLDPDSFFVLASKFYRLDESESASAVPEKDGLVRQWGLTNWEEFTHAFRIASLAYELMENEILDTMETEMRAEGIPEDEMKVLMKQLAQKTASFRD